MAFFIIITPVPRIKLTCSRYSEEILELINYMIIDLLNDDITKYNIVYLKKNYSMIVLYMRRC